jgi:hypothetical protein
MTLRELLKSLHAVDDKYLDVQVLVSPTSGGYEGISHVSVLHVGNAVIHLAEPKKGEAPPDLWEQQAGDVPAVKPDDLKSVWRLFGDMNARNPGQSGAAGDSVYKSVCSPGADALSVWYRASMLALAIKMRPDLLAPWIRDDQPDNAVFEVAATFPMEKMRTGIVREGLPFDVEEFVAATNLRRKI